MDSSSRKTSKFELARVEFKNAINYAAGEHKSTVPCRAHVTILQALSARVAHFAIFEKLVFAITSKVLRIIMEHIVIKNGLDC